MADAHPSDPQRRVSVYNIANFLTVLRIALVPVFVGALMHDSGDGTRWRWIAAIVFALAIFTDKLDGDLARKHGLVTDFGKMADPIADKALIGAALIGLSIIGELPWWVTIVILARELGITLLRFLVIRHGVIPASRGGKAKTFVQSLALWLYVIPIDGFVGTLRWWLMGVAVLLTVITGLDYVFRALRLARGAEAARADTSGTTD